MFWRILLAVTLASSVALGQTVEAIPPGPDKVQPLKLHEPAPYEGMLFDYSTALRWGNWLQQYKLRLKIDVDAEQQKCAVKLDAADKTLALYNAMHKASEDDLRQRVVKLEEQNRKLDDELRNPVWYTTRTFGVIVGVAASALAFGLSTWAVTSLKN